MKYFCYISQAQVDVLFEEAFDSIVDVKESSISQEHSISGSFGVGAILEMIKLGLTFGRSDSSTTKQIERMTPVTRLKDVLIHMQRSALLRDLRTALSEGSQKVGKWYEFSAPLSAKGWTKGCESVDLIGRIDDWSLTLSCATRHFSSLGRERDVVIPSSTNRFLFEKQIELPMSGVLWPAQFDLEKRSLIASPLFLIMNPLDKDLGALNDVAL